MPARRKFLTPDEQLPESGPTGWNGNSPWSGDPAAAAAAGRKGAEAAKRYLDARKEAGLPQRQVPVPVEVAPGEIVELKPLEQAFLLAKLQGHDNTSAYQKARKEVMPDAPENTQGSARVLAYNLAHSPAVLDAWAKMKGSGMIEAASQTYEEWMARMRMREEHAADDRNHGAAAKYMEMQGRALGWLGSGESAPERLPPAAPGELVMQVRANLGDAAAKALAIKIGLANLDPPPDPAASAKNITLTHRED